MWAVDADITTMTEQLTIIAGWRDTRDALARWNRAPARVLGGWALASVTVSVLLLLSTWALAVRLGPADSLVIQGGAFNGPRTLGAAASIFRHNLLTLALHAMICVAGYMAAASVPLAAESYTGWARRVHLAAGPAALVFVSLSALGSLTMQAWTLGHVAPHVAHSLKMPVGELLVLLSPHAIPELTALFLPLGAWMVLARSGRFSELFAASIVTTTVALPLLVMSSLIEVYVTPQILQLAA